MQYDYERCVISNKDLIYKRLESKWARCGKGLSFQNDKVPEASGKGMLTEQEVKFLVLVVDDNFFFFFEFQ